MFFQEKLLWNAVPNCSCIFHTGLHIVGLYHQVLWMVARKKARTSIKFAALSSHPAILAVIGIASSELGRIYSSRYLIFWATKAIHACRSESKQEGRISVSLLIFPIKFDLCYSLELLQVNIHKPSRDKKSVYKPI